jgi:uncharacterized protein (DUF1501 family)
MTNIETRAAQVEAELCEQDATWGTRGWTRRRFIAGMGMVGTAALASQLVTTRASFAATPDTNSLVVIFLRGAADGLQIVVPNTATLGVNYLQRVRPNLLPSAPIALDGGRGFALNPALAPLHQTLWSSGELAFVPAVSSPGISMSHFQAQQYLEKGGSDTAPDGWLDRALGVLGAGTTFRAVALGDATPMSLLGRVPALAMHDLQSFQFPGWDDIIPKTKQAVATLYRGFDGPLGQDVPDMLAALGTAADVRAQAGVQNGADYPTGDFGQALKDIATMLRAEVGLQVATIDAGGWDTHTEQFDALDGNLAAVAKALNAFMIDLGSTRRSRVTVVLMTEFGRRVEMNASGGTDHGHGSVMWLLGGGLAASGVYGRWRELTEAGLDQGNVPGLNNPFDVLGELLQKRLSAGSLRSVFPSHSLHPLGLAKT